MITSEVESRVDREVLKREVASLPTEQKSEAVESRLFDLTLVRMQLGLTENDAERMLRHCKREAEIVMLLEEMRLRLRALMHMVDEILSVLEGEPILMPEMTGAQYEKKIKDYLRNHVDHLVIHRLRSNESLTETDLQDLEQPLCEIGKEDGPTLLGNLLEHTGAPSLAWFVRSLVGMDRAAAQSGFSRFLNDRSLSAAQLRFVQTIIEQPTARGVMEPEALYEPPFRNLHSGGPDAVFAAIDQVIEGISQTLESLSRINRPVVNENRAE